MKLSQFPFIVILLSGVLTTNAKASELGAALIHYPSPGIAPAGETDVGFSLEAFLRFRHFIEFRMNSLDTGDGFLVDEARLITRAAKISFGESFFSIWVPFGVSYPSDAKQDDLRIGQARWIFGLGLGYHEAELEVTRMPKTLPIKREIDTEVFEILPQPYTHIHLSYPIYRVRAAVGMYRDLESNIRSVSLDIPVDNDPILYLAATYRLDAGAFFGINYVPETVDSEKIRHITGVRILEFGQTYLKGGYSHEF